MPAKISSLIFRAEMIQIVGEWQQDGRCSLNLYLHRGAPGTAEVGDGLQLRPRVGQGDAGYLKFQLRTPDPFSGFLGVVGAPAAEPFRHLLGICPSFSQTS